jgi:TPR repeat protein
MSIPEVHLRAAAGSIDQMPSTELQRALRQLKERRNARTQLEVLHQQTELASLDVGDEAAYQLACEAEDKGDLARAAQWYMAAALNDFGDASLKLAMIFDALAEKQFNAQGGNPGTREELDLFSEACRWYADALAAGEAEADELLEKLIDRHFGRSRPSPTGPSAHPPQERSGSALQHQRPLSDRMTPGPDSSQAAGLQSVRMP